MKAAVLVNGKFSIENIAMPTPGEGHLVVRPLACGVCGSDLHTRHHSHQLCELLVRAGSRTAIDPARPLVLGHEFCCEVIDYGPGCRKDIPLGTRVTSAPFIQTASGIAVLGFSNEMSGAFAEVMLLNESAAIAVPQHVPTDIAALAEPLAVAVRVVDVAGADDKSGYAVYGCGPVGLLVIARLRYLGLGPVIAVDPDPHRRMLAELMGAEEVTAPDRETMIKFWQRHGVAFGVSDARAQGANAIRPVIFECVGKAGIIKSVTEDAPVGSTLVIAGVCMETDTFEPGLMIQKQVNLRFTNAYDLGQFEKAVDMINVDPSRFEHLITGHVGLDNVENAFELLEAGGKHAKIIIRPCE